jgi:hypothetical protein
MKKIVMTLLLFTILIGVTGCSSKKDARTLDDFITAFSEQDMSVDKENEPFYSLIGATKGVTFVNEDKIVIYEYDSQKDLDKAKKDYTIIKDWTTNGRFIIETSNEEAIKIFTDVK